MFMQDRRSKHFLAPLYLQYVFLLLQLGLVEKYDTSKSASDISMLGCCSNADSLSSVGVSIPSDKSVIFLMLLKKWCFCCATRKTKHSQSRIRVGEPPFTFPRSKRMSKLKIISMLICFLDRKQP